MRARGADVTDIVVLVVAANDGIMPQTREAIAHSKAAGKTIIVAINKCDLAAADPMKTKSGLMEEGLVPTDFGGDVECVEVSALTGNGIDDLLGLLSLQSEVLELQANPKANCRASIIEARVEPGTGSSATAIVESGTIRIGMPFICGPYAGKVRALVNDHGERVKRSAPGCPWKSSAFPKPRTWATNSWKWNPNARRRNWARNARRNCASSAWPSPARPAWRNCLP